MSFNSASCVKIWLSEVNPSGNSHISDSFSWDVYHHVGGICETYSPADSARKGKCSLYCFSPDLKKYIWVKLSFIILQQVAEWNFWNNIEKSLPKYIWTQHIVTADSVHCAQWWNLPAFWLSICCNMNLLCVAGEEGADLGRNNWQIERTADGAASADRSWRPKCCCDNQLGNFW